MADSQKAGQTQAAHVAETEVGSEADGARITRGQYAFSRYAVQDDHYLGLYETWAKSILFLLNKHYYRWDAKRRMYAPDTEVPPWRQQPVNPFVYAVYRAALSKLIKQRPVADVVPPSYDSEDREAARLGEALLQFLHRHLKLSAKEKRLLGWFLATGNVYGRVYWDAEAGKPVPLTAPVLITDDAGAEQEVECPCGPDGEPLQAEGGAYDLEAAPHTVAEGEIAFAPVSPLCVRFNPEAESAEDATEMYVAYLWPKERAASHFGVDVSKLANTEPGETRAEFDDLLASAAAGGPDLLGLVGGTDRSDAIGERVLVLEYYRNKCREYPEGRHWIQVGQTQVWPAEEDADFPDGEAPIPHGFWPPLIPLQDAPDPASPHAIGLLGNVVPLNEKYNMLDAGILEHEKTMQMGGVWFVAPEDRGLVITSDPAQVKVSKGLVNGRPPVQAKMQPLPEAVYEDRERIVALIQMISGLGELGLGTKPEGVTSGRGFLVLQEAVDSVFTPSLEAYEGFIEEVGRRMLVLAQRHYREKRTISIRGARGQWEFRSFQGADLRDGLDVRVQAGSSFPWSKSAKLDTAIGLVTQMPELVHGADGTLDPQKLAKFLDQGGLAAFQAEDNPDLLEIEREHAMFEAYNPEQGVAELPAIGFWQNHAAHQMGHYEFMKRDYARLMRWHPAARDAFLKHTLETTKVLETLVASMSPEPGPAGSGASPGGDGGAAAAGPGASAGGQEGAPAASVPAGGRLSAPAAPAAPAPPVAPTPADAQLTPADRAAAGE